jgi:hypothetical protein
MTERQWWRMDGTINYRNGKEEDITYGASERAVLFKITELMSSKDVSSLVITLVKEPS